MTEKMGSATVVSPQLVRTGGGRMVHFYDCHVLSSPRTQSAMPWSWATGRTAAEILGAARNGVQFCSHCTGFLRFWAEARPEWRLL